MSQLPTEEQVQIEFWEHDVMSQVRDFINLEGADTFKDALMSFDKEAYNKLFHPERKINPDCYLTTPK